MGLSSPQVNVPTLTVMMLCFFLVLSQSLALLIPPATTDIVGRSREVAVPLFLSSGSSSSSSTSSSLTDNVEYVKMTKSLPPSDEWELDCYSRPVLVPPNNKKLWEVLITDSIGSFRYVQTLSSNQVNSKALRTIVETVMDDYAADDGPKPTTIRFFRGAMYNMINIALSELQVVVRPSRCTYSLAQWLQERHENVYPKMEGYKASMATGIVAGGGTMGGSPSFMDVRTPVKLPDALRGEQYAFVSLPLAEFLPETGSISQDNIGVGRLCPLPTVPSSTTTGLPAADVFVQGIVILTSRARALASWLAGTEVSAITADLRKRTLVMETDIDTQYLMAKLDDGQRREAVAFEEGKDALNGLHFVSVQRDENDDEPAGFWLLREIPSGI